MNNFKALRITAFVSQSMVLVLLLCTASVHGQKEKLSMFDLMEQEEILELTLTTDISQLLASAKREAEYQAASISFESESAGFQTWNLKVKARGKFRRQNCDFPPLKLNFSKSQLEEKGLATYDKLKLVTHCIEGRIIGNENLLSEYLAYQLYQEISPYTYRVQLVKIKYLDEKGKLNGFKRYGFLIESTGQIADRIGGDECEDCTYSQPSEYDQSLTSIHAMFQYMIGNSDYSIPLLRNVKVIRRSLDGQLLPVAYDFDFSGIVEAPYARPAVHMGQYRLNQRIYLGTLVEDRVLEETITLFLNKKERLFEVLKRFRALNGSKRYEIEMYLQSFFEEMEMIRDTGYQNVYHQLREENLLAVPDGGRAADYGIVK